MREARENEKGLWDIIQRDYRNCARKPIPSLPGFSRGMNGACVAKHIAA